MIIISIISEKKGVITRKLLYLFVQSAQKVLRLFSLLLVTLQAFELGRMRCLSGIHFAHVMASPAHRRVCYAEVVGISRHLGIFLAGNTEKKSYDCQNKQDKYHGIFHNFILSYRAPVPRKISQQLCIHS
jgi:hypothetical protein